MLIALLFMSSAMAIIRLTDTCLLIRCQVQQSDQKDVLIFRELGQNGEMQGYCQNCSSEAAGHHDATLIVASARDNNPLIGGSPAIVFFQMVPSLYSSGLVSDQQDRQLPTRLQKKTYLTRYSAESQYPCIKRGHPNKIGKPEIYNLEWRDAHSFSLAHGRVVDLSWPHLGDLLCAFQCVAAKSP